MRRIPIEEITEFYSQDRYPKMTRLSKSEAMEVLVSGNYVHGRTKEGIWTRVSIEVLTEYEAAGEMLEEKRNA